MVTKYQRVIWVAMLHKILLEAWEGDTRLWKVYWIYGVLAGVFLQFLYIAVAGTNAGLVGAVVP